MRAACQLAAASLLAFSTDALVIEGVVRAPRARAELPVVDVPTAGVASGLRVLLNGGERSTYTRDDGRWQFDGLVAGVYLVEIEPAPVVLKDASAPVESAWVYPTFKVQLSEGSSSEGADGGTAQVLEYRYPGAPKLVAKHPIEAVPVARSPYFEERPRASVWSFLKNPTVIMMLVLGVFTVGMPWMMVREDEASLRRQSQLVGPATPACRGGIHGFSGPTAGSNHGRSTYPGAAHSPVLPLSPLCARLRFPRVCRRTWTPRL